MEKILITYTLLKLNRMLLLGMVQITEMMTMQRMQEQLKLVLHGIL